MNHAHVDPACSAPGVPRPPGGRPAPGTELGFVGHHRRQRLAHLEPFIARLVPHRRRWRQRAVVPVVEQVHQGREVPRRSLARSPCTVSMKNVRMPLAGMPVSQSTRPSPRDVAMHLHPTADAGLLVDGEVARGLVGRSGDVDRPARDRAGCRGAPRPRVLARSPAPPRRARSSGSPADFVEATPAPKSPRVSGASAVEQPLPHGAVEQVERAGVRQQVQHAVERRRSSEQRRMVALQVHERQLLDERVAANQHGGDRVRAAVRRAEHDEARARDAGTCAAHVLRPAASASIVRTTRPPIEWASRRIGWLAPLGDRQHRLDRGAQLLARGTSSDWRQSYGNGTTVVASRQVLARALRSRWPAARWP